MISAKENHPSRCQTKARKKHLKCAGWHYPETMIERQELEQCLCDYRKLCCVCERTSGEERSRASVIMTRTDIAGVRFSLPR